jgi:hypothetical protein
MRLGETHTTPEPKLEQVAALSIDDSDVTCRALHVALCAVQLSIAWHSGVISGNAAMAALGQEIDQTPPSNLRDPRESTDCAARIVATRTRRDRAE